ncbi:hypothetical protein M378DRAFT_1006037 [Amanita muscaria Koide BX008]|uniref:Uncharacterized protein n=1 Tax=Amanita muscaria (strain Koide BX008) TaxID=946122 RepID=A0A0C2WSY5_AMAMK|nr:hypothetical protein M378DRAFT_1006037 [Amanita muscaria Koide BX008]
MICLTRKYDLEQSYGDRTCGCRSGHFNWTPVTVVAGGIMSLEGLPAWGILQHTLGYVSYRVILSLAVVFMMLSPLLLRGSPEHDGRLQDSRFKGILLLTDFPAIEEMKMKDQTVDCVYNQQLTTIALPYRLTIGTSQTPSYIDRIRDSQLLDRIWRLRRDAIISTTNYTDVLELLFSGPPTKLLEIPGIRGSHYQEHHVGQDAQSDQLFQASANGVRTRVDRLNLSQ